MELTLEKQTLKEIQKKADNAAISTYCLNEISENINILQSFQEQSEWAAKRAELIVKIGVLLIDKEIDESGFKNLITQLPDEDSTPKREIWSLKGTLLEKWEMTDCGRYQTSYTPDGSEMMGISCSVRPFRPTEPAPQLKSKGCLIALIFLPFTMVGGLINRVVS